MTENIQEEILNQEEVEKHNDMVVSLVEEKVLQAG